MDNIEFEKFEFDNCEKILQAPRGKSKFIHTLQILVEYLEESKLYVTKEFYDASESYHGECVYITASQYYKWMDYSGRNQEALEECKKNGTLGLVEKFNVTPTLKAQWTFCFLCNAIEMRANLYRDGKQENILSRDLDADLDEFSSVVDSFMYESTIILQKTLN